jgi:hypothetical protein
VVISTAYKDKIGGSFSYPIGAEAITVALGGVPQAAKMTIRFSGYNLHRTRWHKPYIVAVINYTNTRRTMFTPRAWEIGPRWDIRIKAVPRQVRHTIQILLKDALAEQARPWLLTHAGAYEGSIGIDMTYDPSTGELIVDFRDRLIPTLLRHRPTGLTHEA